MASKPAPKRQKLTLLSWNDSVDAVRREQAAGRKPTVRTVGSRARLRSVMSYLEKRTGTPVADVG